ncbi:hypothetical protein NVP1104O_60 [Vibrio phage 1.104.O._10N.286.49.A12]|nr:hypothetical protein NVP1104O_60 [Vibrio phage 1.104.O._10N.286.49.A12]
MYYDTIEEAEKAHPDRTHVLTPSLDWSGRPDVVGKFCAVIKKSDNNFYRVNDGIRLKVSGNSWEVVAHSYEYLKRNAAQLTTEQRVTAARFDTASGRIPAHEFLEKGVGHMKDRASQRDAEDGERSMKRCVEAFNALEGTDLTETQGWKFMVMLKMARSVSGDFTTDDYEDMAAYAGLAGESASMEETTSDQ